LLIILIIEQIKDMKERSDIYWIIFGVLLYQMVTYFVLNLVPYAPLRIFTWCFFMLVFAVILILIEEAITFTQAYHLTVLIVVQLILAFGIHINPIAMFIIYQFILKRLQTYIHSNLSKDSLLPLISLDSRSAKKSENKEEGFVYDSVRLMLMTVFMMSVRDSFAPVFFAHFSAPWCFFTSEFPILWAAISLHIFNFKNNLIGVSSVIVCCLSYALLFDSSNFISIFWHVLMASCIVIGLKKTTVLTIILSIYGGMTFFIFLYFPSLLYCTTMYVFMINLTFLGSL